MKDLGQDGDRARDALDCLLAALRTLCFSFRAVCVRAVPEAPQIKSCVATVDTVSEPFSGPQCLGAHISTGAEALPQSARAVCLAKQFPCQPCHRLGQASPTQARMPPLLWAGQRPGAGEGGRADPLSHLLTSELGLFCLSSPLHLYPVWATALLVPGLLRLWTCLT